MNNSKRSIMHGLTSDSIIFVASILMNIAIVPIYLKFISLEEFGIYIAIQSFVTVIALADFGLTIYSVKKMSNNIFFNSDKLFVYLGSAQIYQYILGLFLLLIGYFFSKHIGYLINVRSEFSNITENLFIFSWLSIVINTWFGLNHAILSSKQELKFMNIAFFMIVFISNLLNVFFLYLGFNIMWFGISILVTTILTNIVIAFKVFNSYSINIFFPKTFNLKYIQDGWHYIRQFQIIRIAQVSKTSLFPVLLSSLGGQVLLAQYNITNKMPALIPGFISKLVMNLFPLLSSHFEKNELEELKAVYKKIFKLGIITTLFFIYFLYTLNQVFVEIWVGQDKLVAFEFFLFILFNFFIMSFISFTGMLIQSSGEFKKMPFFAILEMSIFIILSYFLYKFLGILGFFLGYAISSTIGIAYSIVLLAQIIKINLLEWINEDIKYIFALIFFMISVDISVNLILTNLISIFLVKAFLFFIGFIPISINYAGINLKKTFYKDNINDTVIFHESKN